LVRQDDDSLNAASKFRSTAQVLQTTRGSSLEEIQNIISLVREYQKSDVSLSIRGPRTSALGQQREGTRR
jgi:hypothetical protein